VIALLNAYFGEVVAVVEQHGGNVLKFMGDGLLAIFDAEKDPHAVDSALEAARVLQGRIEALTAQRSTDGLPVTGYSLALHIGDVLYGNIGGAARLDFTVIGSAVNTTARILGMCGPLEQALILSAEVAHKVSARKSELVSLGPYMLRGVTRPKELFTLYSEG
jgi:adenylate cyclase